LFGLFSSQAFAVECKRLPQDSNIFFFWGSSDEKFWDSVKCDLNPLKWGGFHIERSNVNNHFYSQGAPESPRSISAVFSDLKRPFTGFYSWVTDPLAPDADFNSMLYALDVVSPPDIPLKQNRFWSFESYQGDQYSISRTADRFTFIGYGGLKFSALSFTGDKGVLLYKYNPEAENCTHLASSILEGCRVGAYLRELDFREKTDLKIYSVGLKLCSLSLKGAGLSVEICTIPGSVKYFV